MNNNSVNNNSGKVYTMDANALFPYSFLKHFLLLILVSEFLRRAVPAQPNQPFRPNVDNPLRASGRLTLREQQVMQLR